MRLGHAVRLLWYIHIIGEGLSTRLPLCFNLMQMSRWKLQFERRRHDVDEGASPSARPFFLARSRANITPMVNRATVIINDNQDKDTGAKGVLSSGRCE